MSELQPLSDAELTEWIADSTRQLAEIAAVVGAREPVPACSPWTMRQLVAHVISGLSGWYPYNMTHGDAPTDLATAWDAQPPLPRGNAERLGYLREVTDGFVALVRSVDLDAPCYVFGDERTIRGWVLRAATECAIHLQDAEAILGKPTPFTPARAATSIEETVRYMWRGGLYFRNDLGAERVPDAPLDLRATDLELAWRVTKAPDEFRIEHLEIDGAAAGTPSELSVTGGRAALISWLWGRSDGEGLEISGDRSLVDAWNLSART
ncbi:MAG: maleylpyruvate isomerase N-terminal domain-containing protein [Acidimicrobiales bacterium]|nr:maleylpyruvate isomerase N-terminal domain-containing protein [Acidimicrobiales bacterium]